MLDTDSKDLVTVHTDGNEQLSVMSYGPGMVVIIAETVCFPCACKVLFSLSVCPLAVWKLTAENVSKNITDDTKKRQTLYLLAVFLTPGKLQVKCFV